MTCLSFYLVGIWFLKIIFVYIFNFININLYIFILYMIQNSNSKKIVSKKKTFLLFKPYSYRIELFKRKSQIRTENLSLSLSHLCPFRYISINIEANIYFFHFSYAIHTVLHLDFSLKNVIWRSFHISSLKASAVQFHLTSLPLMNI